MTKEIAIFTAVLGGVVALILFLGIRKLSGERFQFLAAVPLRKNDDGEWVGLNLTWYGLISGVAYGSGVLLMLFLLGTIDVDLLAVGATLLPLLVVGMPASRWVAQIVEGKKDTFTVGGAVFVGGIIAPGVIWGLNRTGWFDSELPILATLAALSIGYTLGEGLGRLACISFGCCYGKPVAGVTGLGRLFAKWPVVFEGKTRKIAFAANLDGVKVLPIQAVTAVLYSVTAVGCAALFLAGSAGLSLIVSAFVSQVWRATSEFLRADYRGEQKISAYQIMAVVLVVYFAGLSFLLPGVETVVPSVGAGWTTVWQPAPILAVQALVLAVFLYMGRSTQTGAHLRFHVHTDRI